MRPTSQPGYTASWEGFRPGLHLVQCIPHIGYGFRISEAVLSIPSSDLNGEENWLPREVADFWLATLLKTFAKRIAQRIGAAAWAAIAEGSPRQVALLDVAYQAGTGGLSKFWAAVEAGQWNAAANELLFVNPQAGDFTQTHIYKVSPKRAETNAHAIENGAWPN